MNMQMPPLSGTAATNDKTRRFVTHPFSIRLEIRVKVEEGRRGIIFLNLNNLIGFDSRGYRRKKVGTHRDMQLSHFLPHISGDFIKIY